MLAGAHCRATRAITRYPRAAGARPRAGRGYLRPRGNSSRLKPKPQATDNAHMTDAVMSEFARLCAQRFVSLGDAVRSVLTLLETQVPDGKVIFGELNYNTDEYRVLDSRGEGIDALG